MRCPRFDKKGDFFMKNNNQKNQNNKNNTKNCGNKNCGKNQGYHNGEGNE